MMKKYSRYLIYGIAIILVVTISVILKPFKGENIYQVLFTTKTNLQEELTRERQDNYDKMLVEYVEVKERVTGTAPFNSGDTSNADGVDVSDKDDYIRTFDTIQYTLELGIAPNTSVDGVLDSSTFDGGVIKVRAKLPNQGDLVLMTWQEDAWMQNVSYNADKTEIYAEYHVPEGVVITHANQNLTFHAKVGGYKKEVTDDMKPTFEVWMEGNKPDNDASKATSQSVKDNKSLIISGHQSFDIGLVNGPYLNQLGTRNDVRGNYYNVGVYITLLQDVAGFSDLRGIEYPTDRIDMDFKFDYYYNDVGDPDTDLILIDSSTEGAINLSNGTEIVAYGLNGDLSPAYYPYANGMLSCQQLPIGGKQFINEYDKTVEDSGVMTTTIDNNIIHISFEGFKLTGHFPPHNWWSDRVGIEYPNNMGYFAVGNIEFFTPYYNDGKASYDYSYQISLEKYTYNSLFNKNISVTKAINPNLDSSAGDNVVSVSASNRLKGYIGQQATVSSADSGAIPWSSGTAATLIGNTFSIDFRHYMGDGPYEGGTDGLFVWDSSKIELYGYEGSIQEASPLGVTYPLNIIVKYGIYKDDPNNGVQGLALVNSTIHEDFEWYDSQEEASNHGKVAAMLVEDPEHMGFGVYRHFYIRFKVLDKEENIGTVAVVRHKMRVYADKEKKTIYYVGGENSFTSSSFFNPTQYSDSGALLASETPQEYGESMLIVGVQASVNTTVTDLDANNEIKQAYDVQEGEIHVKVTPALSDGRASSDENAYMDSVIVTSILPKGLSYETGSANKEPRSVVVNPDGTTTIEWEYSNWQINHAAPGYPEITYTALISASLDNNQSLEITSKIFTEYDKRNEFWYRTSRYGVVISNLAGTQASKEIDKTIVERNESFNITSLVGNTGQSNIHNVKSLEILPKNGDEAGSKFSGNYTIRVSNLHDDQKLYYATGSIDSIGITTDKYGKQVITNVNLDTDDRWVEVTVGETIPANATALASTIGDIEASTIISYAYEIIPSGNVESDTYYFSMNVSSDDLNSAVMTNTVVATVVEREIHGIVFIDVNRNDLYDEGDTLVNNSTVKLLSSDNREVMRTTTNEQGEYTFSKVAKGDYYVEFTMPGDNYEIIVKGTEANSNKANSNLKTDLIQGLNTPPTAPVISVNNINLGVRSLVAKLIVRHLEEGTNEPLSSQVESTVYYGEHYTTSMATDIPKDYKYLRKTANYEGTVNQDVIEVTYYYIYKYAEIEICKNVTGEGDGRIFQIHVTNENYDTWLNLEKNKCVSILVPEGATYQIEEIIPMDYTLESVRGAININKGEITTKAKETYHVTFTNLYQKQNYFHSYGRIVNKLGKIE